jgi:hypothetical protein
VIYGLQLPVNSPIGEIYKPIYVTWTVEPGYSIDGRTIKKIKKIGYCSQQTDSGRQISNPDAVGNVMLLF